MRMTPLDRCLLQVAMICFLLVAVPPRSAGATCDQECRHVKIYEVDTAAKPCFHLNDDDCTPCVATSNGTCSDTNPPGAGVCSLKNSNQKIAAATGCEAVCTITIAGGPYEATKGTPGKFLPRDGYQCK